MSEKRVGNFVSEVFGPYPCNITIRDSQYGDIRLSHKDLKDLEYIVNWAIKESASLLGKDAGEVY